MQGWAYSCPSPSTRVLNGALSSTTSETLCNKGGCVECVETITVVSDVANMNDHGDVHGNMHDSMRARDFSFPEPWPIREALQTWQGLAPRPAEQVVERGEGTTGRVSSLEGEREAVFRWS